MQSICKLFHAIIILEQQLEALRQLLNQEITFTLVSTFSYVSDGSNELNLFGIKKIVNSQDEKTIDVSEKSIQSMIKFYSGGCLKLNLLAWKAMLLSREDQLLAKLAKERQTAIEQPPQFIFNYCRKVILKEIQIHNHILNLNTDERNILKSVGFCTEVLSNIQDSDAYILKRYLRKGSIEQKEEFPFEVLKELTANTNIKQIQEFLFKKESEFLEKSNKKSPNRNPYVHQQFRKLGVKNQLRAIQFRQSKSIENHINRNQTFSSSRIIMKIQAYSSYIEKQLIVFFHHFRKIMSLNSKIIQRKAEFLTTNQVNFSLLFSEICKNSQMIPSQLQHYCKNLSFNIPLESFFLLFKRYYDPVTGKMNKKQFNAIFKLSNPPQIQKSQKLSPNFRFNFVICVLNEIKYEAKIELEKKTLMDKVDLRQIFEAIDVSNNRTLSKTDMKIISKKIEGKTLKNEVLKQFWWRMRARGQQLIDYDRFMYQLIPRTKNI